MAGIRKAWVYAAVILLVICVFSFPALAENGNSAVRGDCSETFTFTVQSYGSAVLVFSQDQGLCRVQSYGYSGSRRESEVYEWGKYRIRIQALDGRYYTENWEDTADGSYRLTLNSSGTYRIQIIPSMSNEMTSFGTSNQFLYWITSPGWWVSEQRNCSFPSGTTAVITVQQAEAESGTVLNSRSAILYSGVNTVQAGTTPSGYKLLSDSSRTVDVDLYGKTVLDTVTFYYEKTAPDYGTVTVYCYDNRGTWITSYTETIRRSQMLFPRTLDGYTTISGSKAVALNNGVCSPSVVSFYYEAIAPVTPVPITPVPVTPVPITPVPVTPVPVPPSPSESVVQPASWDTQFKPGTTGANSYNDRRYERLPNLSDDNYFTSFEWLVWSGERTDAIPELTAYFNGAAISSIGIRNGYLANYYEYRRYARATGFRIKIFDGNGNEYQTYLTIDDSYSTDYRVFSLGGTYANISRIEFFLDAFACDESEDNGHRYVIHISDIQFYK
ncbi:MAG: hypothetical protein IKG87_00615 [Clostridia bacterium]|nr:hypothetical protein [Clostridia bacterium]